MATQNKNFIVKNGLEVGGTASATSLSLTNALSATNGGTAQSTYTTGDILYASATNTLSKLAAGTSGHVLTSNGASTAPSWQVGTGGGVSTAGGSTITASSSTVIPLVIKGAASQTANLLEIKNSANEIRHEFKPNGSAIFRGTGPDQSSLTVERYTDDVSILVFRSAAGTIASPTIKTTETRIGMVTAEPFDGSSYITSARIIFTAEGTVSAGNIPGRITFNTVPQGGGTGHIERMRIDSAGLVGIGTTPSYPLDVRNAIGQINVTSTTGTNYVRYLASNSGGSFQLGIDNSTGSNFGLGAYSRVIWNDGAHSTVFTTNSVARLTIGSTGTSTFTGQVQSTLANNTADGGGQLYLNGATGNRIDFNVNGIAAPSFTTRSAGTKIVLYPAISGSTIDYALGIESGNMWLSSNAGFKWYSGITNIATLSSAGLFTAVSKSFDIEHPTKPDMRLRYGSLEGPENGVYVRGNTKENIIELPEVWTGLVDESTITVSLTSVGKFQKVYVEKIEDNKIYIGGRVKEISYVVFGERKDIDKITVEY